MARREQLLHASGVAAHCGPLQKTTVSTSVRNSSSRSVVSVWGMLTAVGIVPSARYSRRRLSTSGSPRRMCSMTSSSPTVRTPGASSIGKIVPQVASTTNRPAAPSTGRGTMKASGRRGVRCGGIILTTVPIHN